MSKHPCVIRAFGRIDTLYSSHGHKNQAWSARGKHARMTVSSRTSSEQDVPSREPESPERQCPEFRILLDHEELARGTRQCEVLVEIRVRIADTVINMHDDGSGQRQERTARVLMDEQVSVVQVLDAGLFVTRAC